MKSHKIISEEISHADIALIKKQFAIMADPNVFNLNFTPDQKNEIVHFCRENRIKLDKLNEFPLKEAKDLAFRLRSFFPEETKQKAAEPWWVITFSKQEEKTPHYEFLVKIAQDKKKWIEDFRALEKKVLENSELRKTHDNAYLSILDQFNRTDGKIDFNSLLTVKDMEILLSNKNYEITDSDELRKSDPFDISGTADSVLKKIAALVREKKDLFLPILVEEEGHWIYMLRKDMKWSIYDSQPFEFSEDECPRLTSRQKNIHKLCKNFLIQKMSLPIQGEIVYNSSQKQQNDFDCGTHVVNGWRRLVKRDYADKTHKRMIFEILETQGYDEGALREIPLSDAPTQVDAPQNITSEIPLSDSLTLADTSQNPTNEKRPSTSNTSDPTSMIVGVNPNSHAASNEENISSNHRFFNKPSHPVLPGKESPANFFPDPYDTLESELLENIKDALGEIRDKAIEFGNIEKNLKNKISIRGFTHKLSMKAWEYEKAKKAAQDLYNNISTALAIYTSSDRNLHNYSIFKKNAYEEIDKHRDTLAKHRGVSKLISNILGMIFGLFFIYFAVIFVDWFMLSNRKGVKSWSTDFACRVINLEISIDALSSTFTAR